MPHPSPFFPSKIISKSSRFYWCTHSLLTLKGTLYTVLHLLFLRKGKHKKKYIFSIKCFLIWTGGPLTLEYNCAFDFKIGSQVTWDMYLSSTHICIGAETGFMFFGKNIFEKFLFIFVKK